MSVAPENRSLVDFALGVRDGDIPERARKMAVDAMTDCIACILAGSTEPLVPMLDAVVEARRTEDDGTAAILIGTRRMASRYDAALYNGSLAHAIDYDDTNHPSHVHPSAVLLPALFAIAADPAISGRDIVTAYVVGIEVIGKLGRALNMAHYKRGWHMTATLGTMGAVAAAGRLLRLTPEQFEMAVGIAASCASGIFANIGTMTKPLHAGLASRNGVFAALLAQQGFTANPQALTHPTGFYRTFNGLRGDETIDAAPLQEYGKELEILSQYGLALKPYPCCGATHTAIEAAILLRDEIGPDLGRIKSIRAGVNEIVPRVLLYHKPASLLEGKFSMAYCLASALVDGDVNFNTFEDPARLESAQIASLIDRTTMQPDERCRSIHADFTEFPSLVTIATEDGRTFERFIPLAIGKPERWFTSDRLERKFVDAGSKVLPQPAVEELFAELQALDARPNAKPILRRLRFERSRRAPAPALAGRS